jgi:hypothetical protein
MSSSQPSRRSIRLTFRVSGTNVELIGRDPVGMITPPQVGERPRAGVHGGHWIELRDADDQTLFHRLIDSSALNSVEVHSPDHKIERRFGAVREHVFEVLLPDDEAARSAVLMGDPLTRPKGRRPRAEDSAEIARFDLAGEKGK